MPAGRPTDYRPEYCERAIELGREGYSRVQIAAELDVAKGTLFLWEDAHPEFMYAMKKAMTLSQAWWEKQGNQGIWESQGGPKINAGLYSRSMAARFPDDWRESHKVDNTHANPDGTAMTLFSQVSGRFKPKEAKNASQE